MSPAHRACCFIRRMPAPAGSWKAASHLAWRLRRLTHAQPPSPRPLPPAGEGARKPPREAAALTNRRPSAAMARVDFPSPLAVPRSAGRGAGAAAQHAALRALTCCGCLSGVSEANKASSAAPPHARASQVARSEAKGHGQRGRLFFGYFLLARQKKVTAPPGAHPGQQRLQSMPDSPRRTQPLTPALSPTGRGRKP